MEPTSRSQPIYMCKYNMQAHMCMDSSASIHMHQQICQYTCIPNRKCSLACVFVCVCVCAALDIWARLSHRLVRACARFSMYACMEVYAFVCCACEYVCMHMHAGKCMYTPVYVRVWVCMKVHICTFFMWEREYACMQACWKVYICVHVCARVSMHACRKLHTWMCV